MTETDGPARANCDGHPCPPWCAADHGEELIPGHFARAHGSEKLRVGVGEYDSALVSVTMAPSYGLPAVHVSGAKTPLFVDDRYAEGLACFVEMLAEATPEQHREMAVAIRRAAAQVTESRDAGGPWPGPLGSRIYPGHLCHAQTPRVRC